MNLAQALEVRQRDVVAFVGAGGKTRAMFRLAGELMREGWRVVTTTTTRVPQGDLHHAPQRVGFGHGMRLPASLPEQIEQHRHVFVFAKLEPDNRVRGVRPSWLDENLAPASYLDVLLVEADGSRRLPMKAPLPHEPAMPASATIVVPVAGIDALGQPLGEETIYGAEVIHSLIGHPLGSPVTTQLMAAVLMHPQFGLKRVPPGARIIPLLNKVTPETLPLAREVAGYLLTDANIERVLIGAVEEDNPIWEARRRVGAVILAAGESRRMGEPKLLMDWGGRTIIRQVCEQVAACDLYEVTLVAGQWMEAIQEQVADLPVRVIHNPNYARGEMIASLQVGLRAIWHTSDACLVVLGDQPLTERDVIGGVLQAYHQGRGRIVAPSYQGQRGHPVLIDRAFWQAVVDLPPNTAPRNILQANQHEIYHLVVDTDTVIRDIDTPGDYRQARGGDG
jgi:molybdenum cofactor cytidylyltransferase